MIAADSTKIEEEGRHTGGLVLPKVLEALRAVERGRNAVTKGSPRANFQGENAKPQDPPGSVKYFEIAEASQLQLVIMRMTSTTFQNER